MSDGAKRWVADPKPATRGMSPARAKILAFIVSEMAAGRPFPTDRQISDYMGWAHPSAVRDCLAALMCAGMLRRVHVGKGGRRRYFYELVNLAQVPMRHVCTENA